MMHDCPNTYVRDALPDFVHGSLGEGDRRAVAEHLGACKDCVDELALLRDVLRSAVAPRVDVGRIVAAVPAYRRSPYVGRTYLQVAAALAVAATGVTGVVLTRGARGGGEGQRGPIARATVAAANTSRGDAGVALVDVGELSDASLVRLTREMTTLEAAPPADPEADLEFTALQGGV